ncbi:hypothetical protein F4802DRAFT_408378 [Xylaria palmicola]|nr:hypothetical protein F4802DRAFT_408378 [Xylaria palmicola]
MDAEDQQPGVSKSAGNRVSVACLPCRSRHVRCDAQQPVCIRCSSEGRTCHYVKSRRGGLSRARLAARRRARDSSRTVTGSPSDTTEPGSPVRGAEERETQAPGEGHLSLTPGYSARPTGLEAATNSHEEACSTPNPITDVQFSSVASDFLIKLYYKHFHRCHPCVLPKHSLHRYHDENPGQQSLTLLIDVMRYIGSLYCCPDLTPQLQGKVIEGFQAARRLAPDPFLAQCHILYSIALYWSADKVGARKEIDAAIGIVLSLGMNHRQFAGQHGQGNATLQESFRRTWWQIYCIDAYYAAIKRLPTFPLCEVDTDTDLPCEEEEYESGSIPPPKTLEDFESREFEPENQTFSSFAYLIGATRSIALALSAGSPDASNWLSPKTIAEVDAIIDGWFLLLPKSKREVLKEDDVVDELMFQAQMAVHANLIALHRPFSRLPFHPLEGISSCLVEPPRRLPVKDSETMHTQRCLQSIEAQLRFLVLPVQPLGRSPFTICMTAAGTHTLLAAVKALFSGRQLAVARHQLRLVVGYIKTLGKVWQQGGRNLEEIQAIAQEVLSRKTELPQPPPPPPPPPPQQQTAPERSGLDGQETPLDADAAPYIEGLEGWSNPALMLEAQDALSPYWNLGGDYLPDIPVWFSGY